MMDALRPLKRQEEMGAKKQMEGRRGTSTAFSTTERTGERVD